MDAPVRKRSRSGLLTVLVIFLFGGIFVGGLFLNAHLTADPNYRASTPGVPSQRLTLITSNLQWSAPPDALITELKRVAPDFVLLQQVSHKDAEALADALSMRREGKLQLYYSPTNPNTKEAPGNAILSRHPLYQGRVMVKRGATDAGIWVEPIIGGKRFLLGCLDLTPPPLPAPAARLRKEAIDQLIQSLRDVKEPYIIGGAFPAQFTAPGMTVGDEQGAPLFLASGPWTYTPVPVKADGVKYGQLILGQ